MHSVSVLSLINVQLLVNWFNLYSISIEHASPINNSSIAFYNTENDGALCIGGNDILNEYSDITIYSIKIFDKSLSECLFIKDYHYFINNK